MKANPLAWEVRLSHFLRWVLAITLVVCTVWFALGQMFSQADAADDLEMNGAILFAVVPQTAPGVLKSWAIIGFAMSVVLLALVVYGLTALLCPSASSHRERAQETFVAVAMPLLLVLTEIGSMGQIAFVLMCLGCQALVVFSAVSVLNSKDEEAAARLLALTLVLSFVVYPGGVFWAVALLLQLAILKKYRAVVRTIGIVIAVIVSGMLAFWLSDVCRASMISLEEAASLKTVGPVAPDRLWLFATTLLTGMVVIGMSLLFSLRGELSGERSRSMRLLRGLWHLVHRDAHGMLLLAALGGATMSVLFFPGILSQTQLFLAIAISFWYFAVRWQRFTHRRPRAIGFLLPGILLAATLMLAFTGARA